MARFPFSAIVGQDEMKTALLIAAVEPAIGGVMVFGDRGTGKSTAARALAALLPPITVVEGCRFGCEPDQRGTCPDPCTSGRKAKQAVPFVDLPLGATEDRVIGALDLERALRAGEKSFEPGLLARAHRGFLYVDEINLLEDHLVDLLLDVAASGENLVEREGLSVRHRARFVLIGSGNPEEGELRPQLLDRFGLSVEVRTPESIPDRVEIMRRCSAQERDPEGFAGQWDAAEQKVLRQIARGQKKLPDMDVPDDVLHDAAELCAAVRADGLRGELTLMRAARALAALKGAKAVRREHLLEVAPMALRHRLRRDVLDETGSTARIERAMEELFE
ncbi:Mg-protoporphyrin IX chelatase [Novosphingobium marinum]|uniref:Mg-protoporphyrin IX chelatase n=1 Tax=Novosphingobium marinum TaxID=1514948 RepID=A0A7Y9XXK8_9SPHN|nr:magnesium chelatase ATPase subunit I [Novosphingobium marinum]NYH96407.1 magnesium chelatase subunit I [Novosphingobium marinum]GGC34941.1 Mg-protoporphyrin IX chelatase [Novosphingobium marinum]